MNAERIMYAISNGRKKSYELCDNLLRFYYAFVYKNKSALTMLGADAFYRMKGLAPGNIGFICISGFEPNELPYEQISGEMLYG